MQDIKNIDDFTIGDTYSLTRTLSTVPGSHIVTDAFWTVKSDVDLPDVDAVFSIHITRYTTASGIGEVTNNADGSAQLQFIAEPTVSLLMDGASVYYYDIHINLDSGEKYMVENGKLFTNRIVRRTH
jgi:hypothetical protein